MVAQLDLRSITPTICGLMDVQIPKECEAQPIEDLLSRGKIERGLVFAADALGTVTHDLYPNKFQPLYQSTTVTVDLRAMYPSVTPVCFGSMFSGAKPEVHGIRSYTKPVLTIETMFDSFIEAGKSVAIIAVKDSSIGIIFGNRAIDYYLENYDKEVLDRALNVLESDKHELIVVYQQEFDDVMHKTSPTSEVAQKAIEHHVEAYMTILDKVKQTWAGQEWMTAFVTDHGTHVDKESQKGTHGTDSEDDMQTRHFFTFK